MFRPTWILCALFCIFVTAKCEAPKTLVRELDDHTWHELLEGEWMVEFYAPWCPACIALKDAWRELSLRADSKLAIKIAAIDVTESAGLSGRFFVTALPTIYHIKNKEFRQYKGPRDVDSMMNWLQEGHWKQVEPISSWKSPHSVQMSVLAWFFRLSQALRGIHTMLMETYGLPVWGSYLIFSIVTIFIGAIFGVLLVCCVDAVMPARRATREGEGEPILPKTAEEEISEDLVDDAETQSSGDEENESQSEDTPGDGAGEVRKRKPRKAE